MCYQAEVWKISLVKPLKTLDEYVSVWEMWCHKAAATILCAVMGREVPKLPSCRLGTS